MTTRMGSVSKSKSRHWSPHTSPRRQPVAASRRNTSAFSGLRDAAARSITRRTSSTVGGVISGRFTRGGVAPVGRVAVDEAPSDCLCKRSAQQRVEPEHRRRLALPDGAEVAVEVIDELGRDLGELLGLEALGELVDQAPVVVERRW